MNGDITIVNCEYRRKAKKDEEGDQFFSRKRLSDANTRSYENKEIQLVKCTLFNVTFV